MPITYTSRKGKTYTLCTNLTKKGKPRYFFALDPEGRQTVDEIPEGWEIRESVEGIVSLARRRPQDITKREVAIIREAIYRHAEIPRYRIDNRSDHIDIHERVPPEEIALKPGEQRRHPRHAPLLRFILIDEKARTFRVQRWCYLGHIDDWIDVGTPGPLEDVAEDWISRLGTESFFERA
jgi:hypothetical protein